MRITQRALGAFDSRSSRSPHDGGADRPGRDLAFAIVLTLAARVLYSAAAAAMLWLRPIDPLLMRSNELTAELAPPLGAAGEWLLRPWERFDTLWYLHIAQAGYDRPEAVVFYPLYPGLIRLGSAILGGPLAAALVVSNLAAFFLFLGLMKLARRDGIDAEPSRAALIACVWPAGFILGAGYPESLVAALTVWSILAARNDRWGWAGVAGFAAGLAKAVGVLVVVPLAMMAARELFRGRSPAAEGAARGVRAAVFALLPLLAPAAVAVWVSGAGRSGAASAYGAYWRTQVAFPWTTLAAAARRAVEGPDALVALNLGALAIVVMLVLALPTRREYTLYALAVVTFFLVKRTEPLLQSTIRYTLCIFPAYLSLSRAVETRWMAWVVAAPLLALNLVLLWHFVHWSLVL